MIFDLKHIVLAIWKSANEDIGVRDLSYEEVICEVAVSLFNFAIDYEDLTPRLLKIKFPLLLPFIFLWFHESHHIRWFTLPFAGALFAHRIMLYRVFVF